MKDSTNNMLDCVIVILVILVIIGLIMKGRSEKFTVNKSDLTNSTHNYTPYELQVNNKKLNLCSNTHMSDDSCILDNGFKDDVSCPVQVMDSQIDSYIKKYVMNGRELCQSEPAKFNRKQIKKYQDEFFGFNDKVNYNTNEEIDPVDKINEAILTQGNELNNVGVKISDVYKDLTQNVYDRSKSNECEPCKKHLVKPSVDKLFNDGYYTEQAHTGEYISDINWKYDFDGVNNGGEFYNDIIGDYEDPFLLKSTNTWKK